jgi:hypothetical protein
MKFVAIASAVQLLNMKKHLEIKRLLSNIISILYTINKIIKIE